MTWFKNDDGYELFFNRDEQLSRSRAALPALECVNNIDYICPTDTDAGGTWIAVNQFGITVCLLNHYQFEQIETYQNWTSRGEIVKQFAVTSDLEAAVHSFNELDLHNYRAFRMFIIEPNGDNRLCVWDGHSPRVEINVTTPKSSSSVDAQHVKTMRKELFQNLRLVESNDTQKYIDYHSSHLPERSKESVCMHRSDAKTVSLSLVSVSSAGISFRYADGSPCESVLGDPISMKLTPSDQSSQLADNMDRVAV